jgi:hypothetical protein
LEFFTQHLQDMRCSFREQPRDESKNWIKDPFNVDIDKLTGLTVAEENGLLKSVWIVHQNFNSRKILWRIFGCMYE